MRLKLARWIIKVLVPGYKVSRIARGYKCKPRMTKKEEGNA